MGGDGGGSHRGVDSVGPPASKRACSFPVTTLRPSCPLPSGGRAVVEAAASFSALRALVLRFCGSLLGVFLGVLLGAQSLRVVLFLGFFLVDDRCEELLHLLGHAGG